MNTIDKMWKDRKVIPYLNQEEYEDYLDTLVMMNKNSSSDIADLLEESLHNLKFWVSSFRNKNEFISDVFCQPCYSFYQEFVLGIVLKK